MLYVCYITAFTTAMSVAVVFLALPLLALERFGVGNFQLGFLGAACAGVYIGSSWLSGRVSERLPIRLQLTVAACVLAGSFHGCFHAPNFVVLVLLNAVNGLAMGLFWAPLEGVVSRLSRPDDVRSNMGRYNLSWSAGMTIGFFLFSRVGPVAFHFGPVLVFSVGLLLRFLRAPDAKVAPVAALIDPEERRTNGRRRFFLLTSWSAVCAAFACTGAARQLFPKLATELQISGGTIGYIYGAGLAAQTVGMAAMGRFHGWHYRKPTVYLGELGLVAAGLFIALGRGPVHFCLGHILLGFAMATLYSSSLYYSMVDPVDAHRNTSVHESLIGLGNVTPMFVGFAADRYRYTRLSFYLTAGIALTLLCVQLTLLAAGKLGRGRAASTLPSTVPEEGRKRVA